MSSARFGRFGLVRSAKTFGVQRRALSTECSRLVCSHLSIVLLAYSCARTQNPNTYQTHMFREPHDRPLLILLLISLLCSSLHPPPLCVGIFTSIRFVQLFYYSWSQGQAQGR